MGVAKGEVRRGEPHLDIQVVRKNKCGSWRWAGKLLMQFTNSLAWTRDPGRAFDELFNCVLQTIYLRGAPKAPTLCFSDRWLVAARAIMPLDSRGWPGRDRAACCCSNKLSGAAALSSVAGRGGEGGEALT